MSCAVADSIRGDLAFGSAYDAARVFIDYWSGEGAWESMSPLRRDAIATRMRSVAAQFQALFVEPLSLREVARLCIPTMVMTGECTVRVMQRMAEHLRTTLPHARHRWIAGAGHMGPITHPGAFERSVLSFLGEGQQMAA